jgi:hypothetical protein
MTAEFQKGTQMAAEEGTPMDADGFPEPTTP